MRIDGDLPSPSPRDTMTLPVCLPVCLDMQPLFLCLIFVSSATCPAEEVGSENVVTGMQSMMFLLYFRRSMAAEVLTRASLRCSCSLFLHSIAARASPLRRLFSLCCMILAITQSLSTGSVSGCSFPAGRPVGWLLFTVHVVRARQLMCHRLFKWRSRVCSPRPGSAPPALCSLCSFSVPLYKLLGLAGETA